LSTTDHTLFSLASTFFGLALSSHKAFSKI
jgi:hypothetical protein